MEYRYKLTATKPDGSLLEYCPRFNNGQTIEAAVVWRDLGYTDITHYEKDKYDGTYRVPCHKQLG